MTLVTAYVNPDLDGTAGAIAYAELLASQGHEADAAFVGELHEEARYVLERFSIPAPKQIENADSYSKVILVDASDLNGLEGRIPPHKVVEIVDHRQIHEAEKFPNAAKVHIELVGAAATLVAEKWMTANEQISRESAILLQAAIISNTLNFQATHTTERDHTAARWLQGYTDLPEQFWEELFLAKSDLSGPKLVERIRGDFALVTLGGLRIGIGQIEMIGVAKLVHERKDEIDRLLAQLKTEQQLDHILVSLIELRERFNLFVASDEQTQKLLGAVLQVNFLDGVARRPGLIMRKQITPLIRDHLSQQKMVLEGVI